MNEYSQRTLAKVPTVYLVPLTASRASTAREPTANYIRKVRECEIYYDTFSSLYLPVHHSWEVDPRHHHKDLTGTMECETIILLRIKTNCVEFAKYYYRIDGILN